MKKILIATHSYFAKGALNTVELLVGEQTDVSVINAYTNDSDYTEEVDSFFEGYSTENEYIVFTDLYGGSVNQKLFGYKEKFDFHLITGFNLPIILEVLLSPNKLTTEDVEELINNCRLEMKLVVGEETDSNDEEDFL